MLNYKNRPPHLFLDNYCYFITARTKNKVRFFNANRKKNMLSRVIQQGIKKFNIRIFAYVVLDNHYHLLIKLESSKVLPGFIRNIHANSARLANIEDKERGRDIWFNYWDHCIRGEADFWKHFNYIHNNPVKHNYVNNLNQLHLYKFSSYNQWVKKHNAEWIASCFAQHPIADFSLPDNA
jgi:putative transposase